jgi:hypothetical protein
VPLGKPGAKHRFNDSVARHAGVAPAHPRHLPPKGFFPEVGVPQGTSRRARCRSHSF